MGGGVDELGEGLVIVGTTLACEVLVDEVDTSVEPGGQTLCALEPDRWVRAMPAMVGTASMDLTLKLIGHKHSEIEAFLAESPPGRTGSTSSRSSRLPVSAPRSWNRTPADSSGA